MLQTALPVQENRFAGYDIIGDVHGCYQQLVDLIELLGYSKQGGVYRYKNQRQPRQLVFLGDLLDRGPQIRETVLLVQELVERDLAVMVMGNHEHSAIAYHTLKAGSETEYLRSHNSRHDRQIGATLKQFANHPGDWSASLEWLKQLPLFLQWQHFRIIHACWDHKLINEFWQQQQSERLDAEFLQQAAKPASFAQRFMDRATRGIDLPLPDGEHIVGRDGYSRSRFRVKFWPSPRRCYKDIAFQPDPLPEHIAGLPLPAELIADLPSYGHDEIPLFVGHYWCAGMPAPISPNIACLDYSAVHKGKLVAYRMLQEPELNPEQFVWVDMPIQTWR